MTSTEHEISLCEFEQSFICRNWFEPKSGSITMTKERQEKEKKTPRWKTQTKEGHAPNSKVSADQQQAPSTGGRRVMPCQYGQPSPETG